MTDFATPHEAAPTPAIIVLAGAFGAGKSTLASQLAALCLSGVHCYFFDMIGGDTPLGDVSARFPDGDAFRAWALDEWLTRLLRNDSQAAVTVLEAQVRPREAYAAFERHGVTGGEVLFVHCSDEERHTRLHGPRGQPELANPEMDTWASHLRREPEALGVPILDTTNATPEERLNVLRERVVEILAVRRHSSALSCSAG